ncbi:DHH family phosphoesterase [Candidatus Micrarchaeota archaeon]|nr:DHH family phosphoesterase [Candidatus Micrarchaeota archaeon]
METLKKTFEKFLAKYGSAKIAIVTHSRADVDAIGSAYAMNKILPNSIICTSEEMREGARLLCEKLDIKVKDLRNLKKTDFEGIVVVDTSAYTLVPEAKGWEILCMIDHHRSDGKDMHGEFEIIDHESPSTAEIITGILDDGNIGKETAFALAIAIIADAARFKSARTNTFETLAKLMKISKAEYSELLSFAEPEPKQEAKIAMLSAMKKVNYIYAAGHVIATTETESNESDVASLITEAADVAFVAKWKDREQETRISARAMKSTDIHLNTVMAEVGRELGGVGGGHPKAAGLAVPVHTDEALQKCIDIFIRYVEKQKKYE